LGLKHNTPLAWSYEYEKHKTLSAGKVLLAEPFLEDENFYRTAILLCKHHSIEGSTGLILNKPVTIDPEELLDNFPKGFGGKLHLGGPVGTDMIQIIHCMGHLISGSHALCEGVWWGGDFEQLKKLIRQGKITSKHVQFYIGYSGWDAGQLQQELQEHTWIISEPRYEQVFTAQPDTVWRDMLQRMGGIYSQLAASPLHPSLN
jgi:putative transcriptional regulator